MPQYSGVFAPEAIELVVRNSYEGLAATATVTDSLPILTERFARDRLRAVAHDQGLKLNKTPQVLFVCVHNAGRSQVAAAWIDALSGGKVAVRSAGSAPSGSIHPVVTEAMNEVGIALVDAFLKPLTDDVVRGSDVIITMGCGDA